MPRPKSLTLPQVAAAALAVIDRDGLAALTMRAVAAELGMATMSLYRYVADRDALERLVVERVLGRVDTSPPPGVPWDRQVAALMERVWAAVGAHPEVVPLTMAHRHASHSLLRWSESVLTVLTGAGFDGERRVIALRALLSHVIGALQTEHLSPLPGSGTAAMAGLPHEEFPLLAETASAARRIAPGEEFRGGLALLLRGLRAPHEGAPVSR
ncbi:TetR/AcrR family transcriptional regulator [Streptomyces sp. SBT349]|uniref:TetR/AcrR family transcriptional regulator n=1 Tax=Streptomyces sp. SBT349 TaxID=1580539 RepID=UPI00066B9B82|nr:TetR/AcrR family transcriptional regulator [Streptomyces sp. SBT349]